MQIKQSVVIFTPYYLPHVGGLEKYVERLARSLTNRSYSVIIITSQVFSAKKLEKINGVHIVRLDSFLLFGSRYPLPYNIFQIGKVFHTYIRNKKPFIIINTRLFTISAIGVVLATLIRQTPLVIEHGSGHIPISSPILKGVSRIHEFLLAHFINLFHPRYAAVSMSSQVWLKKNKLQSAGIISNAVVMKTLSNTRKKTVLFAGRLLKEKGVLSLVKAFLLFKQKHMEYSLIVVGAGECEEQLKEYEKENSSIKLLGLLSSNELAQLYSRAELLVYPADYPDGLATVLLEAAVQKLPIICSGTQSNRELITHLKTGYILENNDPQTIANSLSWMTNHSKKRKEMADDLCTFVLARYNWERSIDILLRILHAKT